LSVEVLYLFSSPLEYYQGMVTVLVETVQLERSQWEARALEVPTLDYFRATQANLHGVRPWRCVWGTNVVETSHWTLVQREAHHRVLLVRVDS